jgi:sulfite reductase alpha subunit-like flavoprotein
MTSNDVLILYGSQTGNSEDIAKDVHEKCIEAKISSLCQNLNSVKKVDLKSIAKFVVIVCSTTGNGDTPENADGWWRSIKLRSAVGIQVFLFLAILESLNNLLSY